MYLVTPTQQGNDFMRGLTDKLFSVKILTNSLSSHNVPAVNSHYEPGRDDFIRSVFIANLTVATQGDAIGHRFNNTVFTGPQTRPATSISGEPVANTGNGLCHQALSGCRCRRGLVSTAHPDPATG